MSNEKQTLVDWLSGIDKYRNITIEEWQQAKEMEKERIIKAFDDGDYNYQYSRKTGNDFENGEEYFEETYGGNK
jgi:hypothetical protein